MNPQSPSQSLDQPTTESTLVEACQAACDGWELQLSQWLCTLRPWLQRRCTARLGNAFDAEDAVQEIAIKVMRSIRQFEGRSSLRTWVSRIADNHCNNVLRSNASHTLSDHLQNDLALLEEDRLTHLENTDSATDVERVNRTLSAMTSSNQEILQLRFFADLSLDDMATALNLSFSATKMRLYRAMNTFKDTHEALQA